MKRLFIAFALFFFGITTQAQTFNNEWIDFTKTYYKFKTDETALHRIPQNALAASGINLNGGNLRMYYKGQEIPIYVSTSGTMGPSDFVEFFGHENDGEFDTQMFLIPDYQLQDKTSLFTDEATYFLVSNPVGTPLRIEDATNNIAGAPAPEDYFMYNSKTVVDQAFHFGEPFFTSGTFSYYSTFDQGEGFCSSLVKEIINPATGNNVATPFKVATDHAYLDAPVIASVNTTVVGRNKSTGVIWDKHLEIQVDDVTFIEDDTAFKKFDVRRYGFDLPLESIENTPDFTGVANTRVKFLAWDGIGPGGFPFDTEYSVAEVEIRYPRAFNFSNKDRFEFELELNTTKFIEIENFDGGTAPVLYDLTTNKRIEPVVSAGKYQFKLDASGPTLHQFFFSNTDASSIVEVNSLSPRGFTDYSIAANQGDYMIISHPSLRVGPDHVQQYADYRESMNGGGHEVVIADIEELYDQFAWGIEKHPLSVRNFVQYALNQWPEDPKHLFIIGKGVRYDKTRSNQNNFDACLIPSFGYVPSDLMFTTASTQSYFPLMAVGRIPVKDPNEVGIYLDKMQQYESLFQLTDCDEILDRDWMRNILHISKGWGTMENQSFLNNLNVYDDIYTDPNLGFNVVDTLSDLFGPIPSGQPNSYGSAPEVPGYINDGLAFINYVGHSAPVESYWQYDFQHPSEYDNEGKYPFILSNSCFVGKINEAPKAGVDYTIEKDVMAQDWVLYEDGGAIAFLAAVALSSPGFLHIFTEEFCNNLNDEYYGESVGLNVMHTIQDIYNPTDNGIRIVSNEFTFTGDPAVEMYHWDVPELLVSNVNMYNNTDGVTLDPINTGSTVNIDFTIESFGKAVDEDISVTIKVYDATGNLISSSTQMVAAPEIEEDYSITYMVPNGLPSGVGQLEIVVDGENLYEEDCEANNSFAQTANIIDNCATPFELDFNNTTVAYCETENNIPLSFTTSTGQNLNITDGNFTVDGVIQTGFDPSILGPGVYQLGFSYTDVNSGCTGANGQTVQVYQEPNADFEIVNANSGGSSICIGQSVNVSALSLQANPIWDFGVDAIADFQADGSVEVSYLSSGTKTVSLTYDTDGCGPTTVSNDVDVQAALPVPELVSCNDPLNDSFISLNLDIEDYSGSLNYFIDGVYSGNNVSAYGANNPTFFQVNDIDDFSLEIFVNGTSPCGAADTITITNEDCSAIACSPLDLGFTFTGGATQITFCDGDNNPQLTQVSPNYTGGIYSGSGINANGVFNPSQIEVGSTVMLAYTFDPENGCPEESESISATLEAAPDVTLSTPNGTITGTVQICQGEEATIMAPVGAADYVWTGPNNYSNNSNVPMITVDVPGVYTVVASSANGCQSNNSAFLDFYPTTNINTGLNPEAICVENPNITLQASPSGGTFGGVGVTGNIFSPSAAGLGTVSLTYAYTDDNGCDYEDSFAITVDNSCVSNCGPLELNPSSSQATYCADSPSETLQAEVPGGIFTGDGVNSNTGIFTPSSAAVGTTITIFYDYEDENECFYSESFDVTVEATPTASIVGETAICTNGSTQLTGPNGLGYEWTLNGSIVGNMQTLNASQVGTYILTVTNGSGCSDTESTTITLEEDADLGINQNPTDICIGDPVQLTSTVMGGTWSGTGVNATGLFAPSATGFGSYDITYSVDDDCESSNTITVNVVPLPNATIAGNTILCGNTNTLLSVATGADDYQWSGPNGFTASGVNTISISEAGTYTVSVTDNNCVNTGSLVVSSNAAPPINLSQNQQSVCASAAGFDLIVDTEGGVFTGSGVNPAGFFNPALANIGEQTITYTLNIDGCPTPFTDFVNIIVTEAPQATFTGNPANCTTGSTTLSAPNNYDAYVWTPSNGSPIMGQTIIVSESDTYTLMVENNGCTETSAPFGVTVQAAPSINLVQNQQSVCASAAGFDLIVDTEGGVFTGNGVNPAGFFNPALAVVGEQVITYTLNIAGCPDPFTETVNITVTEAPQATFTGNTANCDGGTTTLSAPNNYDAYTWTPNNGTPIMGQTILVSQSDTYTLTVENNGCTETSAPFGVTIQAAPSINLTQNQQSFCETASSYQLMVDSPGGTFSGTGVTTNGMFSPQLAGINIHPITYTLVLPNCPEPFQQTISINVEAAPEANASGNIQECFAGTTTLSAPSGYDSYSWIPSSNPTATINNQTIVVTESDTYTLTVENNDCVESEVYDVVVATAPNIGLASNQLTFCMNEAPYQFTTLTTGGLFSGTGISATGIFDPSIAGGAGTYPVLYTKNIDGCTYTANETITVYETPNAQVNGQLFVCDANQTILSAPAGFESYTWTDINGSLLGDASSITVAISGNVTLEVANGPCSDSQTVTVSINEEPNVDWSANPETFCQNDGIYTFETNLPGGTFSGEGINADGEFDPSTVGPVTITYNYNQGNCPVEATYPIEVVAQPNVTVSGENILCGDDGFAVLGATSGFQSYNWVNLSSGTQQQGSSIIIEEAGMWQLTVLDQNGCQAISDYPVTQVGPYTDLGLMENATTICDSSEYTFSVTVEGGTFTINGEPSNGTIEPNSLNSGSNFVVYTYVENGCDFAETLTIDILDCAVACPGLALGLQAENTDACEDGDLINITVTQPNGTLSGPGVNALAYTFDPTIAGIGTHEIVYEYVEESCTYIEETFITVSEGPIPFDIEGDIVFCEDGTATLTAPAGFTYEWSTEEAGQSIVVEEAGMVSVTIFNENLCARTAMIDVTNYPQPDLNIETPANSICTGEELTLTALATNVGGTYTWEDAPGILEVDNNMLIVSPTADQDYTVTFLSDDGCEEIQTVTIAIATGDIPNAEFSVPQATACVGNEITFTNLSVNANDNLWTITNQTTGTITTSELVEPILTFTEVGTYDVSLEIQGCGITTDQFELLNSFTVGEGTQFAVSPSTLFVCGEGEVTIVASDNSLDYEWSGDGLITDTGSEITAYVTGETVYTAVATDASGCTTTEQVSIGIVDAPSFGVNTNTSLLCVGNEVTLAANGSDDFTYTWSAEGYEPQEGMEVTFEVTGTTIFTALLNGGPNCTSSESITIETYPDFEVDVPQTISACADAPIQLTASGASGYTWSNAGLLDNPNIPNPIATVSETTTLMLTASGGDNGCSKTIPVTIEVLDDEEITITGSADDIACAGTPTQLNVTGGMSFTWNNEETLDDEFSGMPIATINETTQYDINVLNQNGCMQMETFTLEVYPDFEASLGVDGTVGCTGGEIQLSLTGGADFNWVTTELLSDASIPNPTAVITESTTFEATVFDTNSCAKTVQYVAEVGTAPALNIGGDTLVCSGDAVELMVTDDAAYNYNWTTNTDLLSITNDAITTATVDNTTTFEVEVEWAEGCTETLAITINVDDTQDECEEFRMPPNTITPNGDNMNDTWKIPNLDTTYPEHIISIYNRWGQMLIEFENYADQWNGEINDGSELPEGTYYYILQRTPSDSEPLTGTITILR